MRKFLGHALLGAAVVASIATSAESPPTPPDPVSGPWQSSDAATGIFTLAPDEVMVLTVTVELGDIELSITSDTMRDVKVGDPVTFDLLALPSSLEKAES